MGSLVLPGMLTAAFGFAGARAVSSAAFRNASRWLAREWASSKYYRGGFEPSMTRREASLILGLPQSSSSSRPAVGAAYRKMVTLNHPDRGGSPYLAAKVNEAKEILLKGARR